MASRHFYDDLFARLSVESHTVWTYPLLAILIISAVHYGILSKRFSKPNPSEGKPNTPPLVPYCIPFLGSIPVRFLWDPIQFFSSSKYFARMGHPVRVKIFMNELYIVQGPEHILSLLGHTSTSNRVFNLAFMRNACGMSNKSVDRFDSPSEKIPDYHGRKNYLNVPPLYSWSSTAIHDYLTGRSALHLFRRFETHLRNRIQVFNAGTSPEGQMLEDFMDFFVTQVTPALLESMCGTGLCQRNPTFPKAFQKFCDSLPTFMKRTPRFLAPEAYKAREEVVAAVQDWQNWASDQFDPATTPLDENGDDPFWGSKFFRERYSTFVYDLGFPPLDMAANELGFLLGASSNATLNTFWCVYHEFKDDTLLADIRNEVKSCKVAGDDLHFDVTRLLKQPLLEAVFAETLRLRCHNMFTRKTSEDIQVGDWLIPANRFAIAWSTHGHMDPKIWCDVSGNLPPVEVFCPYRFIKPEGDGEPMRFTLSGTEGSWVPFGSGANICPGRNFAKIHSILTIAMMVESFDCDMLAPSKDVRSDLSKFGMGVLGLSGKIPVRLWKRAKSDQ